MAGEQIVANDDDSEKIISNVLMPEMHDLEELLLVKLRYRGELLRLYCALYQLKL